ncbi:hypothetical protein GMORB2_2360 [Geosmithia morbida]|uniref:Uncharacterized protein n=1 Tax=Geosmithia morbida TaxID=1094350 RepID=A0A9P5D3V2_9HYPO|nr:uncharacterized protein GMORB2_2360 [Geosmithia morbida]KAF4120874.1 hypothetical protein GMORB2_2360 [Geosmithia morbida]
MEALNRASAFFVRFGSSEGFKRLENMIDDNSSLHLELNELQIAYRRSLKTLSDETTEFESSKKKFEEELEAETSAKAEAWVQLQKTQEELEKKREEATAIAEEVERKQTEIQGLQDELKQKDSQIGALEEARAERDELRDKLSSVQGEISTMTTDLQEAKGSLAALNSLMVELRDTEENEDNLAKILRNFFTTSYKLIDRFLGQDLPSECLAQSWSTAAQVKQDLESRGIKAPQLPLPPSNSEDAKRMRVALGLLVYGRELARSIWRPTYLTEDEDINNVLDRLSINHPRHESHLRATILGVIQVLPEQQQTAKQKRITRVKHQVYKSLAGLIPEDRHAEFKADIQKLTTKMGDTWEKTQRLETMVEPNFDDFVPEDWKPFPEPTDVNAQSEPVPEQSETPVDGDTGAVQETDDEDDTVCVLWPVFLYPSIDEGGDLVRLQNGYILLRKQCRAAEAESEESEKASRADRKIKRQNGPPRKRRDSGVGFLENGKPSNGSPA